MKLVAFAATNHGASINRMLVEHAAETFVEEFAPKTDIEYIDLNDFEMPIFSPERRKSDGVHPHAQAFFDKMGEADVIMMSLAEYNGSFTAAFKNIFDWASSIDMSVFHKRPTLVMAASPGPRGAQHVLNTMVEVGPFFGADIKASLSVPSFAKTFDKEQKKLVSGELSLELRTALSKLGEAAA